MDFHHSKKGCTERVREFSRQQSMEEKLLPEWGHIIMGKFSEEYIRDVS